MASTSIATAAAAASDFSGAFPEFEPPSPLIFPVFELSLEDDDVAVVGAEAVVTFLTNAVEGFEGFESRDLLLPSDLTLAALDDGVVDSLLLSKLPERLWCCCCLAEFCSRPNLPTVNVVDAALIFFANGAEDDSGGDDFEGGEAATFRLNLGCFVESDLDLLSADCSSSLSTRKS